MSDAFDDAQAVEMLLCVDSICEEMERSVESAPIAAALVMMLVMESVPLILKTRLGTYRTKNLPVITEWRHALGLVTLGAKNQTRYVGWSFAAKSCHMLKRRAHFETNAADPASKCRQGENMENN